MLTKFKHNIKAAAHLLRDIWRTVYWSCFGLPEWFYLKFGISSHDKITSRSSSEPLKIAFVATWYGREISGGAESECYGLVQGVRKHYLDIKVEVFTTCLHEFCADWNQNYHKPGTYEEEGVKIHRFLATEVNRDQFHLLNGTRLMPGGTQELKNAGNRSPVNSLCEAFYLKNMVDSPELYKALESRYDEFDFFVYIPYMFRSTVVGGLLTRPKSVVIPCLHDERYAFMGLFKKLMTEVKATFFHVRSEMTLAKQIYGEGLSNPRLIGEQVAQSHLGNAERFREKYKINAPFILYAGRMIEGKNVPDLLEKFVAYKEKNPGDLKLVFIGKGDVNVNIHDDILSLGFVPEQDKHDAFAAAEVFCLPSLNESFSIVMMESWLQETPVLVHENCAVTRDHCDDSGGGLYYQDQKSFDESLNKLLKDKEWAKQAALKGKAYVQENYSPEVVIKKFVEELTSLRSQ